ncbi:hypothetical protein [Chromobacterium vaccinii]|uniref:hypothetical protein n=1 Tax=Chromobacterium vaccinii TaxID=1108595 RepID=UPI000B15B16D|nr:hypothetical protein [Chromobacterium vaccinii]
MDLKFDSSIVNLNRVTASAAPDRVGSEFDMNLLSISNDGRVPSGAKRERGQESQGLQGESGSKHPRMDKKYDSDSDSEYEEGYQNFAEGDRWKGSDYEHISKVNTDVFNKNQQANIKRLGKISYTGSESEINGGIFSSDAVKNNNVADTRRGDSRFLTANTAKVFERSSLREVEGKYVSALGDLNKNLRTMSFGDAIAMLPKDVKFKVAQYRGLHYRVGDGGFSKEQRFNHRKTNEIARPMYSLAALDQAGFDFDISKWTESNIERLSEIGQKINETISALRKIKYDEQDPVHLQVRSSLPSATDKFNPKTVHDMHSHFYSMNMNDYLGDLSRAVDGSGQAHRPKDILFSELSSKRNPRVSTGDVPVHANRYAYGDKSYKGERDNVLYPEYNNQATPKNRYVGKVYITLHPLEDYNPETGGVQILDLQKQGRVNLTKAILSEAETTFDGYIEKDRLVDHKVAKFPDFSRGYKISYQLKYGMSEELFNEFRSALVNSSGNKTVRNYVETLLVNHLTEYSDVELVARAQVMALRQEACVVYKAGNEFSFQPPKMDRNQIVTWSY